MKLNPTLAKQHAREVCKVGVPLFRHMLAAGSGSSSGGSSRVSLTPAQIQQQLVSFGGQDAAHKAFLEQPSTRNIAQHLDVMLQLLATTDDPLTISADIVTTRFQSMGPHLLQQRTTSLNNVRSAARCGFRGLFGRSLTPGMEASNSTIMVGTDKLAINLHSPVPDAAITDYKASFEARGTLTREAAGVIRTWECYQLHIVYAWHQLLTELGALSRWRAPEYIPASCLQQVSRWTHVLLAWLFRGSVDLGWPADICCYHVGCFQLVLPDGSRTPLAAVVLDSLKQQQQQATGMDAAGSNSNSISSIDQALEAFRQAGAVLLIKVPKVKQCSVKRRRNGDRPLDWLTLRKPLLPVELGVLCPTRTLAFCMAASWFAQGAVTARLLSSPSSMVRAATNSRTSSSGSDGSGSASDDGRPQYQPASASRTHSWPTPSHARAHSSSGLLLELRQLTG